MEATLHKEFEPFEDVDKVENNSIPGASFPDTGDDEYISLEETMKELEDQRLKTGEEKTRL